MADRNGNSSIQSFHLDGYTIIKDIIKEWKTILIIAISAIFFSYSWQYMHYTENYTMTTTFTVNARTNGNDVYSGMSSAADTATTLTQILNSSLLQKKVAQAVGLGYMPGSVSAEVISNTNLMTLKVTESSPQLSYKVMHAVLDNYNTISDSLMGNVVLDILEASEIPQKPDVTFSPWRTMIKAFGATLLVMIFLIGFISAMKDTVRRESEVEQKLDAKLLGTLFHENKYKSFRARRSKKKTGILMLNPTVSFRYSEAVRKLASRVRSKMKQKEAKVLLVTSVLENEGKSTVAANLALALADESKRVLLLDGDFRKPSLYKLFDVDPKNVEAFGEVLNGKKGMDNLVYEIPKVDLKLILNTVMYPDSTELISEGLFSRVLDYLKKNLDYIIIDSSPMALVADTEEMMNMVDAALLVVRQHMASVRDINDAIDVLNGRNMKLLGCVFNDAGGENFSMGHGYGGYGGYGNYGKKSYGYGYAYEQKAMAEAAETRREEDREDEQ